MIILVLLCVICDNKRLPRDRAYSVVVTGGQRMTCYVIHPEPQCQDATTILWIGIISSIQIYNDSIMYVYVCARVNVHIHVPVPVPVNVPVPVHDHVHVQVYVYVYVYVYALSTIAFSCFRKVSRSQNTVFKLNTILASVVFTFVYISQVSSRSDLGLSRRVRTDIVMNKTATIELIVKIIIIFLQSLFCFTNFFAFVSLWCYTTGGITVHISPISFCHVTPKLHSILRTSPKLQN